MVAEGGWLLVAAGVGGDGWKREKRVGGSIKPANCPSAVTDGFLFIGTCP